MVEDIKNHVTMMFSKREGKSSRGAVLRGAHSGLGGRYTSRRGREMAPMITAPRHVCH